MRIIRVLCFLLPVMTIPAACDLPSRNPYSIQKFYSAAEQDSLMTRIMVYIYNVPAGVGKPNKHDRAYRGIYARKLPEFEWVYYHIDPADSTHYFFLIRPVRNPAGNKRGVGGSFKLGGDLALLEFREIFNTPMLPPDTIRARGKYLWDDLLHYKHTDRYFLNKDYIEFPNENCAYDFVLKEWRYDTDSLRVID